MVAGSSSGASSRAWRKEVAACLAGVDAALAAGPSGAFLVVLTDALQSLGIAAPGHPMSLGAAMAHGEPGAGASAAIARRAGADSPDLPAQARLVREQLETAMANPPEVVRTSHGPVGSADLVRLLTAASTAESIRAGGRPPRAALIAACRVLAAVLGERHGGRTIEMRVPPATAVQLEAFGQGPSHHRGTPPNVAETDPATFVALATGLLTWQDARSAGRIQASGSHVDAMARMLPVTPAGDAG